jgi:hypothetical protein
MVEPAAPPPAGCLTDAQIAQLQGAAPGRAPEALARHLASCERCQARALFGAERRRTAAKREPSPVPSIRRALLLTALILGALAAFAWTIQKLAARVP